MIPRKTDIHYRYKIPNIVTVQVDTREKIPMLFPDNIHIAHPELSYQSIPIAVHQERVLLPFGDYRLREYPELCVFERKASQLELYKNLVESHDRIRQAKAFRKLMCGCKYPYVLIEASPAELLSNNSHVDNPEVLCHRLALTLAKYDLRVIFLPWKSRSPDARRKVGTLMIHLMLGHVLKNTFDVPPLLLDGDEKKSEESEILS